MEFADRLLTYRDSRRPLVEKVRDLCRRHGNRYRSYTVGSNFVAELAHAQVKFHIQPHNS